MKIWTEHPAEADVEATIRRYFGLLQAGKTAEVEQLLDQTSVQHVIKALWKGSAGANDDTGDRLAAREWEQDRSWLGELELDDISWGPGGTHARAPITYRAQTIEVQLSFWLRPTDAGWVLTGPSTLW